MSWNTFGRALRFTTWGESHGAALGAVVDGCPPGLALDQAAMTALRRAGPFPPTPTQTALGIFWEY